MGTTVAKLRAKQQIWAVITGDRTGLPIFNQKGYHCTDFWLANQFMPLNLNQQGHCSNWNPITKSCNNQRVMMQFLLFEFATKIPAAPQRFIAPFLRWILMYHYRLIFIQIIRFFFFQLCDTWAWVLVNKIRWRKRGKVPVQRRSMRLQDLFCKAVMLSQPNSKFCWTELCLPSHRKRYSWLSVVVGGSWTTINADTSLR